MVGKPLGTSKIPSGFFIQTLNQQLFKNTNKMTNIANILKEHGVSYLGSIKQSAKMMASFRNHTITYILYLAPANMSGYEVCPCSKHCRKSCLNASGNNKVFMLAGGRNPIQKARIKKTRWFFEDRESFMQVLIHEIKRYRKYAESIGYGFSIRLNGTSDLSPEDFVYEGRNILQIFPDIQFYDYTKVYSRIDLMGKYDNYDLTFSFDGYNWGACECALYRGVRAAVVFSDGLPNTFCGYPVVDGNEYDMRYNDPEECVIGLHYHPTAGDYVNGKFRKPETPFVVDAKIDVRCNVEQFELAI